MGNICGFEWVFDGLPRRCVEFAGHIGAHRTAPFDMVAAVDDVRAIASRLAAAEARAEKAEGERDQWLEAANANSRYARAWQEWAANVLAAIGKQPDGGQHGDGPARGIIEAEVKTLTSELAEARAERVMFCALVESLTSERDEARRQLGEAAKLLRDCPLGYANGALIHCSTTAADVIAWLARVESVRAALYGAAKAGGPHGAGEAK